MYIPTVMRCKRRRTRRCRRMRGVEREEKVGRGEGDDKKTYQGVITSIHS